MTKVPALGHIDVDRVAFSVSHARTRSRVGTYAFIVPLRFEGGAETTMYHRREYRMPTLEIEGAEMLYIIYLLSPRFFELSQQRKLHTVIHELYHISPQLDGDLRRFPGRRWAHGHSREKYDKMISGLVDVYLSHFGVDWPEPAEFLKYSYKDCTGLFGGIRALSIPRPHPILA